MSANNKLAKNSSASNKETKNPPAANNDEKAFAFGGLGGFNAHNAGVLQAVREKGIKPKAISCTSGAIYWTWKFLSGGDIVSDIKAQAAACQQFDKPLDWLNGPWMATFGLPGVFRPALAEYWQRWMEPMKKMDADEFFSRLMPTQTYVPTRPYETFVEIADCFNKSDTPVIFNSHGVKDGFEYLHINPAAEAYLGVKIGTQQTKGIQYVEINPEAVEAALWLYSYGFKPNFEGRIMIDGAYRRQLILRELVQTPTIYAVKPQNDRWEGSAPSNQFELRDFLTELNFNATCAAEIASIQLVNKFINSGRLKVEDTKYKPVNIVPIEIKHQLGFFNYFAESMDVFNRAHARALEIL